MKALKDKFSRNDGICYGLKDKILFETEIDQVTIVGTHVAVILKLCNNNEFNLTDCVYAIKSKVLDEINFKINKN